MPDQAQVPSQRTQELIPPATSTSPAEVPDPAPQKVAPPPIGAKPPATKDTAAKVTAEKPVAIPSPPTKPTQQKIAGAPATPAQLAAPSPVEEKAPPKKVDEAAPQKTEAPSRQEAQPARSSEKPAEPVQPARRDSAAAQQSAPSQPITSWTYHSYYFNGQPYVLGYFSIDKPTGQTKLRFSAGSLNSCYSGELDANVVRARGLTYIYANRDRRNCDEIRLVIRNDGSGGEQLTRKDSKKDAEWVPDGLNHVLTPRK